MALRIGHKILFPPGFIVYLGEEEQRSYFHSQIQLFFNYMPLHSGCSLTSSKDKHSLSHFLDVIPFDLAVVCTSRKGVSGWHDSVVVRYGSSRILFSRRDGYIFWPTIDGCFLAQWIYPVIDDWKCGVFRYVREGDFTGDGYPFLEQCNLDWRILLYIDIFPCKGSNC